MKHEAGLKSGADRPTGDRHSVEHLLEENALLRAALGEMRERLGEAEESKATDPVTGLASRESLVREVDRAIAQAKRHQTPSALILIDLKDLGRINEQHGRVSGDAALTHVGRMLSSLIRNGDTSARVGGRFALLLDHLDPDSAIETAERIARYLAGRPLDLGSSLIKIRTTIGVATILAGDQAEEVLGRAERNLARVKQF